MSSLLRTEKTQAIYDDYIANGGLSDGCKLCKRNAIYETEHWKVIENKFPYDKVASVHNMIIPKRHIQEEDLNKVEIDELNRIKSTHIADNYQYILEATARIKSLPDHFHLHLLVIKN